MKFGAGVGKVDVRLPGKRNSNSHGARPIHLITTMIKGVRTSRLSIKNSLSLVQVFHVNADDPEAVAWVMSVAAEYRQVPPRSSRSRKDTVSLITAEKTRPFADLTEQHAPFRARIRQISPSTFVVLITISYC